MYLALARARCFFFFAFSFLFFYASMNCRIFHLPMSFEGEYPATSSEEKVFSTFLSCFHLPFQEFRLPAINSISLLLEGPWVLCNILGQLLTTLFPGLPLPPLRITRCRQHRALLHLPVFGGLPALDLSGTPSPQRVLTYTKPSMGSAVPVFSLTFSRFSWLSTASSTAREHVFEALSSEREEICWITLTSLATDLQLQPDVPGHTPHAVISPAQTRGRRLLLFEMTSPGLCQASLFSAHMLWLTVFGRKV